MSGMRILLKVLPKDPEKGFERTVEELKELQTKLGFKFVDHRIEEIAFGIKNLYILLFTEENVDMNELEAEISKLDNVGNVEVVGMTRA